jgi:putative transposase
VIYLEVERRVGKMRRRKGKDPNRHNKAFKYRIYPNAEQEIMLSKTFGCVRFIYNSELYHSMEAYEATGKSNIIAYARFKEEYEWLKEVDSLALANAQLNLESAYKKFLDEEEHTYSKKKKEKAERTGRELTFYDYKKHPKFKRKDEGQSYTTNLVNGNIGIIEGRLKVPKIGQVKMKEHRSAPNDYVLKSVTISKTATGKYYASILYEYAQHIAEAEPKVTVGLDFSMGNGYVDNEGNKTQYPTYYRDQESKLAIEQRKLSHMKESGSNYNKQKTRINLIHERIANQRRDYLHKESRKIANFYDLVGIEDMNMQAMAQAMRFGKTVHETGRGMFRQLVEYKMAEQGKHYIKIDKWYPSSRKCSTAECTYHNKELTLEMREWECPECGAHHDRDINAAINIRNEAMRVYEARKRSTESA